MVVGPESFGALHVCTRQKQEVDTDSDADRPTSTEPGHR
jgi:hypothetical protein